MKKWLWLLALVPSVAWGQLNYYGGAQYSSIILNSRGIPAAGATITICLYNATLIPTIVDGADGCRTKTTIYSDPGLNFTKANPFKADGFGNVVFYAPPGVYNYAVTGPTVNPTLYTTVLPCVVGMTNTCGTGGGPHVLLGPQHTDTVPFSPPNIGDLIRGNLNQLWERQPVSQIGEVYTLIDVGGGQPIGEWVFPNTLDTCTNIQNEGVDVGCEHSVNFQAGDNITYTMVDDSANDKVDIKIDGCPSCGGASALPDKFYTLLPDCSTGAYVGIENLTPIESFFAQAFDNFGIANVGESNCFVTDSTDTGLDETAEIKENSGFIRDQFPWTVKFYLRISAVTNIRMWMIFSDSLAVNWQTSDDPSAFAQDAAAFRFSKGTGAGPDPGAGDTFWTMVSMASGAAATITPTAVAPDTDTHKCEISYDGATTLTYKIDGSTVGTQAQTFTDGFPMFWYVTITSLDAGTALDYDFYGVQMTEQTIHTGP